MADNDFRAYRSRDAVARDDIDAHAPDSVRDPLAELARLIGQADPASEYDRRTGQEPALQYEDAAPVAPGQNWAADEAYADQSQYAEQGYEQPAEPHPALRDYPSYQNNPPQPQFDDRYFDPVGSQDPAPRRREAAYNDRYAEDELPPLPRGRQLPALAPQQSYEDEYQDESQWQDERQDEHGDDAYATDEHGRPYAGDEDQEEAERAPRRGRLALVLGVVGLVTIGAASALAYRAMSGGSLIPSLPPIIKASDGPNKIVPAQAANSNGAAASNANSAEKLVPREEQPVPIQPQNAPPRVVATIPVAPQGAAAMGAPPTGAVALPAPVQSAFPPSPSVAAPPAPAPTANPTEPKKVHTVLIKPEQPGSAAPTAQAPAAHSNAPTSLSPHAAPVPHSVPPSSPNAPLALVPTAQGNTPHVAAPRAQVARAEPGAGAPLATSPAAVSSSTPAGGGYSVQVTSQRSEAEAQTSYRELQAKYPAQLGSHHAMIHRADLGDKGTYYRALIGPYSSAEGAAGMCSSLKAAGGSCIVQKN